ncbi:MAG: hypothetical protein U5K75_11540 [Ahrensia sp.]|nr:hypothetical protein [Ahrensia sp.]
MNDETEMSREQISSLLRFYAESGLDFPVGDAPVDRFSVAPDVQPASQSVESQKMSSIGATDPHAPADIEMDPRKRLADAARPIALLRRLLP